jgi:hypothetical protein
MRCDDCSKTDDCAICRQVAADHAHDKLREEGCWTPYDLYLVEQMEARAQRLGYS